MWVMLVSSPVLLINSSAASPPLAMADVLLLSGFLLGVVCEVHCYPYPYPYPNPYPYP